MSWTKQTASKGRGEGEEFERAPAGNHPAVLVAIIDLGTQAEEYKGVAKENHRAYFAWELVACRMSGSARNHVVGIDLNVSLNERAKLRQWVEARKGSPIPDGTEYDIAAELGKPCLLNVTKNNAGYPKVEGMAAVPTGLTVPAPTHSPLIRSLDDYRKAGRVELPDWLPWLYGEELSAVVMGCKEFRTNPLSGATAPGRGDVTPPPPVPLAAPAPPAPPQAERRFWFFDGNPGTPPALMTFSQVQTMYQGEKVDWGRSMLCPEGQTAYQPIGLVIPESAKWVPF